MTTPIAVPEFTKISIADIPTEILERVREIAVRNGCPPSNAGAVRFAFMQYAQTVGASDAAAHAPPEAPPGERGIG